MKKKSQVIFSAFLLALVVLFIPQIKADAKTYTKTNYTVPVMTLKANDYTYYGNYSWLDSIVPAGEQGSICKVSVSLASTKATDNNGKKVATVSKVYTSNADGIHAKQLKMKCSKTKNVVFCNIKINCTIYTHDYSWVVDRQPTCSKVGLKHKVCSHCGATKNANTEIAKKAHTVQKQVISAATCTKPEYRHDVCTTCGAETRSKYKSKEALGHDYTAPQSTEIIGTASEPTTWDSVCKRCGEVNPDTDALVYDYVYMYTPSDFGGITYYCSNRETRGHTEDRIFIDPVDTKDQLVRNNGNKSVLRPGPAGSWDSRHVCDPSVIRGNFTYGGVNYPYLMAYLGISNENDLAQQGKKLENAYAANEIGFAVSQDKVHWTKIGTNPVVSSRDKSQFYGKKPNGSIGWSWGVGQPSLINKNGTVYLFYTRATIAESTQYVCRVNNDLSLTNLGRMGTNGIGDWVNNADFAYDGNTLYMIYESHKDGFDYNWNTNPQVTNAQRIFKANWDGVSSITNLNWTYVTTIGQAQTGHTQNHNACLNRDELGGLRCHGAYVSTADINKGDNDYPKNVNTYQWFWIFW